MVGNMDKCEKIVSILEDKKALNICVLDVSHKSDLFDYQILCSGLNEKHTQAIASEIIGRAKTEDLGFDVLGSEGFKTGHWIVLDLGSMFLHVFEKSCRDYYALEEVFGK
jgi:ribosome-associated protein